MWESHDPLDAYALVHMTSAGGDALVAIALADSVFFSIPIGQSKVKVALYLALTMAPLAVASPLVVPFLDRGGFRRVLSFCAALGRAAAAMYMAAKVDTVLLFPSAFVLLVLSKIHAIAKNGLTMAYAPSHRGLVEANARLGRIAVVGTAMVAGPGLIFIKLGGAPAVLYLAAAVYAVSALFNLRLPQPKGFGVDHTAVEKLGAVPSLAVPAIGAAGLRAASGYLLFLLAFSLRQSHEPAYWFGSLAGGALVGAFLGDLVAPRLPVSIREDRVVLGALVGAGVAALVAFRLFDLFVLVGFTALSGMATEFGRLAFQSLMQRSAPAGAQGKVFVHYEVAFQLAWVGGALIPALIGMSFRTGILLLSVFYLLVGLTYVLRPRWKRVPEPPPAARGP